jgi:hypothetical protein
MGHFAAHHAHRAAKHKRLANRAKAKHPAARKGKAHPHKGAPRHKK